MSRNFDLDDFLVPVFGSDSRGEQLLESEVPSVPIAAAVDLDLVLVEEPSPEVESTVVEDVEASAEELAPYAFFASAAPALLCSEASVTEANDKTEHARITSTESARRRLKTLKRKDMLYSRDP